MTFPALPRTRIIVGDVRTRLARLPSESVHCIVTSPPYFRLRDYGCVGQIGLEPTPDAYISVLVDVFREARRVLRRDGTFWLNLGDSYASAGPGSFRAGNPDKNGGNSNRNGTAVAGIAPKQRLMIPARVALALQADEWWLRDEIIWHKPNPMPISVKDRTTPAHEMLYMFSRSARYFFDMEAVLEPASTFRRQNSCGILSPKTRHLQEDGTHGKGGDLGVNYDRETRQPRSVWSIATRPYRGAHFATFPPDLIKPCILAGSPRGGVVLDPFFGAGTTGLVAKQLGRHSIGIELNFRYAMMALARVAA